MKTMLAYCLCATFLAAIITSGPGAPQTATPPLGMTHPPMELQRNADGSIKRGLRNTVVTGYWSGYAATAAAPYTSASATFQIPRVSNSGSGYSYEDSALWVGIGGYGDSTLIRSAPSSWSHPPVPHPTMFGTSCIRQPPCISDTR